MIYTIYSCKKCGEPVERVGHVTAKGFVCYPCKRKGLIEYARNKKKAGDK